MVSAKPTMAISDGAIAQGHVYNTYVRNGSAVYAHCHARKADTCGLDRAETDDLFSWALMLLVDIFLPDREKHEKMGELDQRKC